MIEKFASAALGRQYKLASRKGTLLGTITLSPLFEAYLEHWGRVDIVIMNYDSMKSLLSPGDADRPLPDLTTHGTLAPSYYIRDALELIGMTVEQFETIPGCSFSPSAAYLRSLMA